MCQSDSSQLFVLQNIGLHFPSFWEESWALSLSAGGLTSRVSCQVESQLEMIYDNKGELNNNLN